MPVYVLDTNIFIQAHRVSYPLDVATSFWNALKKLADEKKVISIDKVKTEIDKNEDELKEWVEAHLPEDFFKSTEEQEILNNYGLMAPWAESRSDHYQRGAIDEFLDFGNADAWLVAWCKVTDDTLVTQEVSKPGQKNGFQFHKCANILMFHTVI